MNGAWQRVMTLPGLAAVLCVPVAALVVVLLLRVQSEQQTAAARQAALTSARRAATDLLSYDYRTMATDTARATADTTGTFRRQYTGQVPLLTQEAQDVHAIVQAAVRTTSVVTATSNQVVVLLFVDQASVKQVGGATVPQTRIDESRVRMTLTQVGGRWLVSALASV